MHETRTKQDRRCSLSRNRSASRADARRHRTTSWDRKGTRCSTWTRTSLDQLSRSRSRQRRLAMQHMPQRATQSREMVSTSHRPRRGHMPSLAALSTIPPLQQRPSGQSRTSLAVSSSTRHLHLAVPRAELPRSRSTPRRRGTRMRTVPHSSRRSTATKSENSL